LPVEQETRREKAGVYYHPISRRPSTVDAHNDAGLQALSDSRPLAKAQLIKEIRADVAALHSDSRNARQVPVRLSLAHDCLRAAFLSFTHHFLATAI
jgi:hypothetical protein